MVDDKTIILAPLHPSKINPPKEVSALMAYGEHKEELERGYDVLAIIVVKGN